MITLRSTIALLSVTLFLLSMTVLSGCGGGSGGGSKPATPPTAVRNPDPLYSECVSPTPIDGGNPNQPVITLVGPKVINHSLGAAYVDMGANANDAHDGDLSSAIQVTGLTTLDTNAAGDYLVRYNVKNSSQLAAVEVVRIVRVNSGTFAKQTARDIGTTSGHMGYYEHLPVNYSADPEQKFPLIIYQHGWEHARFLDAYTVQAPLSTLEEGGLVKIINDGVWDDSRPFIVLSPQRCLDPLEFAGVTAAQTKRFIDFAINTYNVDTSRIYMGGHSQGSGDTWDYVYNYPQQLAAIFPISGDYGDSSGCMLNKTPAWAFIGALDITVPYRLQTATVESINACNPEERARVTVFPQASHNDIELPIFSLSGLGQGMSQYDLYDQDLFDWLLEHERT